VVVLAGPVLTIVDWMRQLADVLGPHQLLTDVGSTKQKIVEAAAEHYNRPRRAAFLPGHPMAGKEVSGAEHADASLFRSAVWLFTPVVPFTPEPRAASAASEFRARVEGFGCRTLDMDAGRHDELLAWVSHLPQFLSTALSALLEDEYGGDAELRAIGGRALREMTRLGSSPYSMWGDVALTNTEQIARALETLERRLAHLRENLRTPGLQQEFAQANRFRATAPS
jgi:prephenate dehydrogenase